LFSSYFVYLTAFVQQVDTALSS